jgi:hypothetical protein
MKTSIKKIFYVGLIIFLLMQLYQPARNISYEKLTTTSYTKVYQVPKNVASVLQTSCYDCHTNNTRYPWYSYIQPVRFFMDSHINKGKENLNFSEWGNYSNRKQNNKLDRIAKEIKANEMPLSSYIFIHKKAILTPSQKKKLSIG